MENIKKVLNEASVITKKFEDEQKASGELFNIFSITKIERVEVNTHSAMIAELLNPSGSHGQGDKFLILFLKIVIPSLPFTETQKSKIFTEKSFAPLGRVDILIELEKDVFLIENKIDAKDGKEQLKRYADILTSFEKSGKKGHLIYLTKFGIEAEKHSHCGVKYQCISYREQILDWLDLCIKAVDSIPAIKHTLLQYQYLIKKITGTSMTDEMKKELVDLLMEGDNFQAAQAISEVIRLTKGEILFKFFQNVENTIKKQPDVVSAIKGSFPELEYDNKNRCINWFSTKKGIKTHSIGVFFDIGIPDILFRIEVATELLYYGVVAVKKDKNGKYEFATDWKNLKIEINTHFKEQPWGGINWFSKPVVSVFNDVNLSCIRNEEEQKFIEEAIEAIKELKLAKSK